MSPTAEPTRCANCGVPAGPSYCPSCGQEVAARQGPLASVVRDVLADIWSLDSRLVRSLRALVRPGELSRLYVDGKRAPFLRPFRLYLLASLVLFSTVLTLDTPDASSFDIYIGGELVSVADVPASKGGSGATANLRRSLQFMKDDSVLTGLAGDRVARLGELPRQELVELIFSGLRRMLPATLVLFVPFLALGLKLLYIRKRAAHNLYLEHLVFSLHFQSALFVALALAWLVVRLAGMPLIASGMVYALTTLAILVAYLPAALRRFYRQSRLWTAIKTIAVLVVYLQLLDLALGLSILVAIWEV